MPSWVPRIPFILASRLLGAVVFLAGQFATAAAAETLTGRVVAIADGDTLTILTPDKVQHRIRFDGIDAPEKAQAFGNRSRENLARLVFRREVIAECPKRDRYGRAVCVVLEQGRAGSSGYDVGLQQIKDGMAWWFKRYASEQTPENRAAYEEAEREAREAKRGLWRDAHPVAPWEFRAQQRESKPR